MKKIILKNEIFLKKKNKKKNLIQNKFYFYFYDNNIHVFISLATKPFIFQSLSGTYCQ